MAKRLLNYNITETCRLVSGRVDDSNGVPQDEVGIYIDQYDRRRRGDGVAPCRNYRARSKADGTFVFEEPVTAGKWDLSLYGRQKVAPASVEILPREAFTTLLIETVRVCPSL